MTKRILLYGFSRYLGFSRNPSGELVRELSALSWPGIRITPHVFKVSYEEVQNRIPRLLGKDSYDAVVGFGLAAGSSRIRLEQIARNLCDSPQPDQDGKKRLKKAILKHQKSVYRSTVKLSDMRMSLLKENIPAVVSRDAGGYLCNFTYYLMAHHLIQHRREVPNLFVHIPFSSEIVCRQDLEYPSLPQAMFVRAGKVIIKNLDKGRTPNSPI